jgi:acyl-CoA thioester hydrolase
MPFVHRVTVAAADIDNLAHASNLVYLRWVQEAALGHTTALGWPEERYIARGEAWVVRKHEIEYVRPALAGDALRVETRVATMGAATSVRRTQIFREADGALLCRAATEWVYVNLGKQRPMRIPDDVKQSFPIEPD